MGYLDEDVLYNIVEEKYKIAKGEARAAYSDVLDTICEMPRAHVAPRAEVARKIFAEIYSYLTPYPNRCALISIDALAILKKKYTEAEPPKGV